MEQNSKYVLPDLPYDYSALKPYISEEQLRLHHDKHHLAYVNGANALLDKLAQSREAKKEIDVKNTAKELSFNIGGHLLHSLFWENMLPAGKNTQPEGKIKAVLDKEFGSYDNFKSEFSKAALTTEGSGSKKKQ